MLYHSRSRRHIFQHLTATFLTAVLLITLVPFKRRVFASRPTRRAVTESTASTTRAVANTSEDNFAETSAMPSDGGVRVQWRVTSDADTRGYYVYRIRNRRVTLATRISPSESSADRNSYQWLDPEGSSDSIYYIESIPLNRTSKIHDAVVVTAAQKLSSSGRRAQLPNSATVSEDERSARSIVRESPAALLSQSVAAAINDQWAIAAQTALKIQIKSDGWYRVTQQQMSTAGFNPTVDIRNLSLFSDGRELAIRTSKDTGQLTTGDYIEFYGRGLDTPDADTRVYFLIAGTLPGKRTANQAVGNNTQGASTAQLPGPDFTYKGMFLPLLNLFESANASEVSKGEKPTAKRQQPQSTEFHLLSPPNQLLPGSESAVDIANRRPDLNTTTAPAPETAKAVRAAEAPPISKAKGKGTGKSKAKNRFRHAKSRSRTNRSKPRLNHASSLAATSVPSFDDTLQIKERFNYNPQLPVGQNFFGATMGTTFSLTQKLTVNNLQSSAEGPVLLEIALQGISITTHQVNVRVNGVLIGTMNFFGHGRPVQTFSVPVSQLVEGDNTIKFEPQLSNEFIGVDYIKLTYPHSYTANGNTLRFSARSAQTVNVDGFSVSNVLLLDISDPFNVGLTHPASAVSGTGFAITVPPGPHKARGPRFGAPELQPVRTMCALPEGQFQQPAGLSLNQPSTLNQSTNRADLLIISAKDFLPAIAPLVAQRQAQGLLVQIADVEDVYDEFSFGAHSSQAVQDFLLHAATHWATAPRYVLLAGDASYDPRDHSSVALVRANKGCTDTNNNAADFGSILFGNAHTSAFALTPPCSSPSGITISQIYTGIGEAGGSYTNSYIELFNGSAAPINLNGWSVQYASGTGTTWQVTPLNLTVQPNHYYLVKEASSGGTFPLPTADAAGNISLSTRAGKIALVNSTTPLAGACPTGGSIVDFVGYGSAANCFEGSGPAAIANDFVPTKQVDTTFGAACSDDSLADFNNDGVPEIAVGRLPARTPAEANLIVSKIVSFSKANVPQKALFVADAQGSYYWNFESHSDDLANLVPLSPKQKIYLASQPSPAACEANIINAINQGVALVNYQGHGNVNVWSGASIFTAGDANALTNGNRLPLVVVADCLNGLFDDPVLEGLAETLLKAPNGGAVAAYASSGETIPDGQQDMSVRVYQLLFGPQSLALGDVTKQAKTSTTDLDVRRTWILLGDPSMKIW